eukprot:CAMPEP_0184664928 /NCGR_PEP_ID=MMETSP0308-20130426/54916_1 /TAXON_ID=38269 /ORGANISM="Gloeochaete witrockiana, Strain SAG 46.84" /LENGTH=336 /DNA_ID=CAMNT_0027108621 /DNA_START=112 /DNA_END=1122 /DNA_ORIENTATION=-
MAKDGVAFIVKIVISIAAWYIFSALATLYNKIVYTEKCPCSPAALTLGQMLAGAIFAGASILAGVRSYQPMSREQAKSVILLSIGHVLGNFATNMSIMAVAASLTHTIKAAEPVFAVILTRIFIGEKGSPLMYASLGIIVLGVGMASSGNLSMNWTGLITALISNLCFSSRNVLSKLSYGKHSFDETNLFFHMSWLGALIWIPFSGIQMYQFLISPDDGVTVADAAINGPIKIGGGCLTVVFLASVFHWLYNQCSFLVLSQMSPISHAVANCMKRAVVILSALMYFHTPVNSVTGSGTFLALFGVAAYSRYKLKQQKEKKPAPAPVAPAPPTGTQV